MKSLLSLVLVASIATSTVPVAAQERTESTSRLFAGDQSRAGPAERVQHHAPTSAAVANGALHQLDWFHSRVQVIDVRFIHVPDITLVASATPKVSLALSPTVENSLKLSLIVRSAQCKGALTPDEIRAPMPAGIGERSV